MTITEVSKLYDITPDTLRYYERIGLIPPIPRNKSGIRDYDERAISWIEFVMKFKKSGASLESIIEYLKLAGSKDDTKEARREILFEVKENLTSLIERLQECLHNVEFKINNYYDLCEPITREMMQQWNEKLDKM